MSCFFFNCWNRLFFCSLLLLITLLVQFVHLHSQTLRDQDVNYAPKPPADVCTPAGVAKLLIKDGKKLSSKDLREGKDDLRSLRSRIKHNFPLFVLHLSQLAE